jgi:hypothetical protein
LSYKRLREKNLISGLRRTCLKIKICASAQQQTCKFQAQVIELSEMDKRHLHIERKPGMEHSPINRTFCNCIYIVSRRLKERRKILDGNEFGMKAYPLHSLHDQE